MEPKKRVRDPMSRVASQKTQKVTDKSSMAPNKKLTSSVVSRPTNPPRLTSRSGGTVVKASGSKQKPKR